MAKNINLHAAGRHVLAIAGWTQPCLDPRCHYLVGQIYQAENVGEFTCPGFIDWAFFKWFGGGMRKGQPNAEDLANAHAFAESL